MKNAVVIISDIHGELDAGWMHAYVDILKPNFDVSVFNAQELASIKAAGLSEKEIHEQFLNGGIDRAVLNLLARIKSAQYIIGFSIGGLIAWKAALIETITEKLIAISSTRLRHETEKPNCEIQLFYGEGDNFKPDDAWFRRMKVPNEFLLGYGHVLYKDMFLIPYFLRQLNFTK